MPPIHVLHIITRLIIGGAQENTVLTVEGLDRLSRMADDNHVHYRTKLVTGPAIGPEGDLIERARHHNVDLVVLPNLRREVSPWRDATALRDLTRIFRQERPAIVHSHSSKAGILARVAARSLGLPALFTAHGWAFTDGVPTLQRIGARWIERGASPLAQRIILVSDYDRRIAIRSKVGNPDRQVIDIAGDGSFMMTCQELAAAVTEEIPVVVLVMNDYCLGMVKQLQDAFYGRRYEACKFGRNVDFARLAESMGAIGIKVTKEQEIAPAIEKSLAAGRPAVVDCVLEDPGNVYPMVTGSSLLEYVE